MRLLVVVSCLLASSCLAQKPQQCTSPPLMSGGFSMSTQNEKLILYASYQYDALGQRMRLKEIGTYENRTFTYEALLLFRQGTMYEIDVSKRSCKKKPLKADFHPLAIPRDASLGAQYVLGSSSGPLQGLLVNTWTGDLPNKGGIYLATVTEFGCIPVSVVYRTEQFGWVVITLYNNVIGLSDPGQLNPPPFCPDKDAAPDSNEKPSDFLSVFLDRP